MGAFAFQAEFAGAEEIAEKQKKQRLAANTSKWCTLELGGHAPVLVFKAAEICAAFKFRNAGQVCTSPTRFYVQRAVYEEFVGLFSKQAMSLEVGNGIDENVNMGPLIAPRRLEAMECLISNAEFNGATIAAGGDRIGNVGYFFEATILRGFPTGAGSISNKVGMLDPGKCAGLMLVRRRDLDMAPLIDLVTISRPRSGTGLRIGIR